MAGSSSESVDVTDWTPNERARGRLGRTFQEARLFPSLTVTEVIAVACERTVANRSLDRRCHPPTGVVRGRGA